MANTTNNSPKPKDTTESTQSETTSDNTDVTLHDEVVTENNQVVESPRPAEPSHDTDSQLEAQNKAQQTNQIEADKAREELRAAQEKLDADRDAFEKERATAQKSDQEPDAENAKRIAAKRVKDIDGRKDLSDDDKEILKQYDRGVQIFAIAKNVFKFVNNDTVGTVLLTIRREHADDFSEIENINSTKGYTGF